MIPTTVNTVTVTTLNTVTTNMNMNRNRNMTLNTMVIATTAQRSRGLETIRTEVWRDVC